MEGLHIGHVASGTYATTSAATSPIATREMTVTTSHFILDGCRCCSSTACPMEVYTTSMYLEIRLHLPCLAPRLPNFLGNLFSRCFYKIPPRLEKIPPPPRPLPGDPLGRDGALVRAAAAPGRGLAWPSDSQVKASERSIDQAADSSGGRPGRGRPPGAGGTRWQGS